MLIVSYLKVVYIMETANMEKRYHYKVVPKNKQFSYLEVFMSKLGEREFINILR